ncbi:hypothetical protein Nepgr_015696 [Nepenthes gracilis]|uniref:Uncharacterized protein n=1 Tax=Nepenthes gracilis TaxID=150966 RepID=A0AAD3SNB0_NEPGR|nr:hypothetical protein Nepgr_015696 [Nepenthes gracilis]
MRGGSSCSRQNDIVGAAWGAIIGGYDRHDCDQTTTSPLPAAAAAAAAPTPLISRISLAPPCDRFFSHVLPAAPYKSHLLLSSSRPASVSSLSSLPVGRLCQKTALQFKVRTRCSQIRALIKLVRIENKCPAPHIKIQFHT